MSIEKLLEENTAAANRLADLLEKGGATTGKTTSAKTTTTTSTKPKATFEDVKTAVIEVKDRIDEPSAKAILEKHGGKGTKLAAVANKPETWPKILASCAAAIAALDEAGDEPAGDEDDGI